MSQDSAGPGSVSPGSRKQGSENRDPESQGSAGHGSESQGSAGTGTPGQGSAGRKFNKFKPGSAAAPSASEVNPDPTTVRVTSSALKAAVAPIAREKTGPYVPPSLASGAALSWRFIVVAAAVLVLGKGLIMFKTLAIPVAIALLLTVLLQPLHRFLTHTARMPRALSAILSLLTLLAAVTGLVVVAGQQIAQGVSELTDKAVAGVQEMMRWAQGEPLNLDLSGVNEYWTNLLNNFQDYSGTLISGALSVTSTLGHVVTGVLIVVFCTIFFLIDGRRIWSWLIGLLPRHVRERTHQAGRRGLVTLSSYVRTQILVAFIDAVGIGLGAFLIGLPLAIPMGVLVFLGSFIPFIGAIVTGTIAILVALVVKGWFWALVMMGIVLLIQQLESHVLQPFLMGKAVSLHPVAVLLTVLAGSLLAGIVGALFAVPVVAVLNTVVLYFHGHDKFPQLGFEDHIEIRPAGRHPVMVTSAARYVADGPWDQRADTAEPTAMAPLDRWWSKLPKLGRTDADADLTAETNRTDQPDAGPDARPGASPRDTPDGK